MYSMIVAGSALLARTPQSLSYFKEGLGSGLIGTWLTTALYGAACAQAYHYFTEYATDPNWIKAFVTACSAINTVHVALTCAGIYYSLVLTAFDPVAALNVPWYLAGSFGTRVVISLLYLAYFTWLAYQLSGPRERYVVAALLTTLALGHVATGIVVTTRVAQTQLAPDLPDLKNLMRAMASTQLAADAVLCITLCVLLHRHKTVFKSTNAMINTLMVFAVSRGIVTVVAALVELLAMTLSPKSLLFTGVEYAVSGLYTNSLLLTLNARSTIRDIGAAKPPPSNSYTLPLSTIVARVPGSQSQSHGSSVESQRMMEENMKNGPASLTEKTPTL